jgi:hypothetical protein
MRLLGNPQWGIAGQDNPPPEYIDIAGDPIKFSVCEDCGGYYMAYCPCWHSPGGRWNPLQKLKPTIITRIVRYLKGV